ncbi:hypothetical protein HY68_36760 [Streptomyces sp. AcH 505]|uniref:DUF6221 family protein n=1 Tax=Streptomyces sp. AcH 505 TaxID=352211 RepID=UPI000591F5A9|nr:hypothetical protein HY68_36760 [Streptomyces sp. AcH 505]
MSTAAGEGILGWLNGAISNWERIAGDAASEAGGTWSEGPFVYGVRDQRHALVARSRENRAASIVHIALNDPESVLRRCAADRKLLELHGGRGHSCPAYDYDGDLDEFARFYNHEVCPVVQNLAEGYGLTEGSR